MTHLLAEGGYQVFTLGSNEKTWLYFAIVCALAAIGVALFLVRGVLAADQGTASMQDIAKAIQEGAEAFLSRQFKTIGVLAVVLAGLWARGAGVRSKASRALGRAAPYLRLLAVVVGDDRRVVADAEGAEWQEVARIVLHRDPVGEPEKSWRCWDAHLKRARWMTKHGYRHLLKGASSC